METPNMATRFIEAAFETHPYKSIMETLFFTLTAHWT